MFCGNCGTKLGKGNFCPNCGAPINRVAESRKDIIVEKQENKFDYDYGTGHRTETAAAASGSVPAKDNTGGILVIVFGILFIILAITFAFTANKYWDNFRAYLNWFDDTEAIGIIALLLFPILYGLEGIMWVISGVRSLGDNCISKKDNTKVLILSDGMLNLIFGIILKIFQAIYEYSSKNPISVHTIWQVINIYEIPITFMIVLGAIMLIAGILGLMKRQKQIL